MNGIRVGLMVFVPCVLVYLTLLGDAVSRREELKRAETKEKDNE